jgi:hypothetical protein
MGYAEWEACVSSGLDLWAWATDMYPKWFKVKVIAFHNLRGIVKSHVEQAEADELDRKKKRPRG